MRRAMPAQRSGSTARHPGAHYHRKRHVFARAQGLPCAGLRFAGVDHCGGAGASCADATQIYLRPSAWKRRESLSLLERGSLTSPDLSCPRTGTTVCRGACIRALRDAQSLRSLSQDLEMTGELGQSGAWRTWTGPPEGAPGRPASRLSCGSVQDRRVRSGFSRTAVVSLGQPWCQCTCVAGSAEPDSPRRRWARHPHENGVPHAAAPSYKVQSCSESIQRPPSPTASLGFALAVRSALAPEAVASSK